MSRAIEKASAEYEAAGMRSVAAMCAYEAAVAAEYGDPNGAEEWHASAQSWNQDAASMSAYARSI